MIYTHVTDGLLNELEEHRKNLHRIPEVGFKEFKTHEYLKNAIEETKPDEMKIVATTGIIAYYRSKEQDVNTIAFRSDIDALTIKEQTGLEFESEHDGFMHACGHDAHMAMLLGLASYIAKHRDEIKVNILLIFQPAEEGPGGAKPIVEANVLENYKVDSIFGTHVYPEVDEGKVAIKKGPTMAMTGEVDIIVNGVGAHGALPHKGIDAIVVASEVIQSLQTIISRKVSPVQPGVLTIGKIMGGDRCNVIADRVTMEGTLRAFNDDVYNIIKDSIVAVAKGLEISHGVKIDVVFRDMYPFVNNDVVLVEKLRELMRDEWVDIEPQMTAEDFSYYQRRVPGVFMLLGTRNEEDGLVFPLHNSKFNLNTKVLAYGVEAYIRIVKGLY